MKVTLIQSKLFWEEPEKNRDHLEKLINGTEGKTDLIVLPEMFTTGFSMSPEKVAEPAGGTTLSWLKKIASAKQSVITGSVAVKEGENYYNRLYWVYPSGNYSEYNKRHLFRMAKEEQHYKQGSERIIREIGKWKVCPLVCYDLRFPVWCRNKWHRNENRWDYDVLIFVANWPEIRSYPWKQLLIARAIENQCYVIGVNRVGEDGNGYAHSGDSVVINPKGEAISKIQPGKEQAETIKLDMKYLEEYRKQFPVGMDADDFRLLE
jgi:omega-amidase